MQKQECCSGKGAPHQGIRRRDFLRLAGASTLTVLASRPLVMAGPFTRGDFARLVPEDKKLDPAWIKSLFERGTPEILSGANLRHVGMPVDEFCLEQ